ncbi:hypothetical protein [Pseudomonas viridiflava]|uniref:hypothetical protein n=1 Tax=Pseudomonas viridiflava TaxID=33069 RepID=UPI0013CECD07|nr:hypothetical protein [Pseudomonas viridiflava]MBV1810092.1 hypothetical protein [Pseudomonas viridiflava]
MLPKAVLFDLDNTLTNRALSIERYVKCFLKDFGLVVHADSQAIVRLISEVDNGGYLKAGSVFPSIRKAVGHILAHELAWRVAQTPQTLSDHWQIHLHVRQWRCPAASFWLRSYHVETSGLPLSPTARSPPVMRSRNEWNRLSN